MKVNDLSEEEGQTRRISCWLAFFSFHIDRMTSTVRERNGYLNLQLQAPKTAKNAPRRQNGAMCSGEEGTPVEGTRGAKLYGNVATHVNGTWKRLVSCKCLFRFLKNHFIFVSI